MYLHGRKNILSRRDFRSPREDNYRITAVEIELAYWRKHQQLHDYMVRNFAKGVDDCKPIELDLDDLQSIIDDVRSNNERILDASEEERAEYIRVFNNALVWLEAAPAPAPNFTPKPMTTEIGDTLSKIGLTVFEIDEDTFPLVPTETRHVIYQASW